MSRNRPWGVVIATTFLLASLAGCQSLPGFHEDSLSEDVRRVDDSADDASAWQSIKTTRDQAALIEFIHKYPYSDLISKAKLRLKLIADGDIR